MEHTNVAQGPPWKWWPGGPPLTNLQFEHKIAQNDKPVYEIWISTLTIKQTQEAKNKIDEIQSQGVWDDYKKITNPYEYVFLSLNRRMIRSVSSRVPLSRSFYKMLEIWQGGELFDDIKLLINRDGGLYSAHAAEGPGGFIEALYEVVPKVIYSQAMTMRSTTRNIPGWRKTSSFLGKHPEIHITYGETDTGDLLLLKNIDYFVKKFGEKKAHIYTADGGFDFSSDFNAQEESILPLLTAEFYLGLKCLCKGGVLIVKIFDATLRPTLELLWIVTRSFREWSIIKPRTSRGGNAERYMVCKGFLGLDDEVDRFFRKSIELATDTKIIQSCLKIKPSQEWLQVMLVLQEAISKQETEIIEKTLELIKRPIEANVRSYIEQNVERSIQWCIEHKDPIKPNWFDSEWYNNTINEEIRELLNSYGQRSSNTVIAWRGVEASQNDLPEHYQQQQRRHAVLFSRSRPARFDQSTSRARRANNPDEEGWQRV
jgi:cap1 methyltransferase